MDSSKVSIDFDDDIRVWERSWLTWKPWKAYSKLRFRYVREEELELEEDGDEEKIKESSDSELFEEEKFGENDEVDEEEKPKYFLQVYSNEKGIKKEINTKEMSKKYRAFIKFMQILIIIARKAKLSN